jgi:hypothetical protein
MEACIGTLEHEHVAYPEDDPHTRAPARAAFVIGKGITWDVWLGLSSAYDANTIMYM